ncbi:hypothetical protein ABK040_005942 [Willaertia magna]
MNNRPPSSSPSTNNKGFGGQNSNNNGNQQRNNNNRNQGQNNSNKQNRQPNSNNNKQQGFVITQQPQPKQQQQKPPHNQQQQEKKEEKQPTTPQLEDNEPTVEVDEPPVQLTINTKLGGIQTFTVDYKQQEDKLEINKNETFTNSSSISSEILTYSNDGSYLAFIEKNDPLSQSKISRLYITDSFTGKLKYTLVQPKEVALSKICFSPKNTFLITLGKWNGDNNTLNDLSYNLKVWRLKESVITSIGEEANNNENSSNVVPTLNLQPSSSVNDDEVIALNEKDHLMIKFSHKPTEGDNWPVIQFNEDESLMGYFNPSKETVTFYDHKFELRNDLVVDRKVHAFKLSLKNTFAIYTYNTNKQTEQNSVRIYKLPNTKRPSATKHFSVNVDSVEMKWNRWGTALLVYATINTDQSDKSYYGENKLYYIRTNGNISKEIQLEEEGPVHDLQFSNSHGGQEFIAIYGYSGSIRATLFDGQTKPIFEFLQAGKESGLGGNNWKVNKIFYSPHSRFLVLAGFGGFTGTLLFFDRDRKRLMGINQASEPTIAQWSPDSRFFIVGTHFPKLRVDNKYFIYKYNGQLLYKLELPQGDALYHAIFRPIIPQRYKQLAPSPRAINQGTALIKTGGNPSAVTNNSSKQQSSFQSVAPTSAPPKATAYVPPHLRNQTSLPSVPQPRGGNTNNNNSGNTGVKTVVANIFGNSNNSFPTLGQVTSQQQQPKKKPQRRKKKKPTNPNQPSNGDDKDEEEEEVIGM